MNKWLDRYEDGRQVVPISDNTSYRKPIVPISKQEMFNNLVGVPNFYQFNSDPNADAPGRRALSEEYATKYKTKKALKKALKVADVTTDIMQLGNFIPLPQAQAIGKLGNVLGTGIDAFQGGMDVAEGNYGSAGINFASAFLPKVIENYGYKRDMFNTTPGSYADKIANLGSRSGEYIHLTPYANQATNPVIMKGVNFNRGLLGALGAETAIDLNQKENGGLVSKNSLNRNVTCSNCGWSWKLSDGGMDPMTCHKCGGDIKMKKGGELDEYEDRGEVRYSVPSSDVMQNRVPIGMQQIPIDPLTGQPLTREQISRFMPSFNTQQPSISQGTWKGNRTTKDNSFDPYLRIIEKDPQSEANVGKRMKKDFITKTVPAGITAAAAIMAAPLAAPIVSAAMNAPLAGVAGLTGSNIINAGFATHGLKSVLSGDVAKPWQQAYKSSNPWDYANAVGENAMTALELAPLVGPGYRGALQVGKYLNKKNNQVVSNLKNNIFAGALSKNLSFNKPSFNVDAPYLPKRIDPIDRSTVNVKNDFLKQMFQSDYDEIIKKIYDKYGEVYDAPLIEYKSSRPISFMPGVGVEDQEISEEATLFKEKFCLPDSECAKTANAVTNKIFTDITGKPFDAIGNAHNAWHMEDQMTRHGGVNLQNRVPLRVGDRILMGNGVNQSTYAPGYTADPRIRHAGTFAGLHERANGDVVPMIFESGKMSPLYLNPLEYTFTGPNTALESIRPRQFIDNTFGKALVDKNIRYAFRDKPAVAIYNSDNKAVQEVLNNAEPFRETIKKTYDITNDEFNELLNSLVSIGGQETKLNKALPGSKLAKAKIQLQNSLNTFGLLKPIKQTVNTLKQTANNIRPLTNSNLPLYPGSSKVEMEAAILAEKNNISFNNALVQIKSQYQPKPKFSISTVEPSKGMFRQKYQTETDRLSNFGQDLKSKNSIENGLGQMSENYNKVKKAYPDATPRQLMDITTLMWNSPGKALDKQLVDFYIFGKNNPNPSKFNFDYVSKINKIKDKYINVKPQLVDPYLEIFKNKKYPIIQYKEGGAIITNRGQWDYPGQTTIIPSNQITMQGVPYPVLGVDNTGYTQMMQPQMNYTFPGQYVTEYPMAQNGIQVKKSSNILSRENVSGDALTSTLKREAVAAFPYLQGIGKSIEKGISYITPDYKSQEDRELLFRRHRPVQYPSLSSGLADVVRDYSSRIFNTEIQKPFRDKEGDYEASEEAWRMTLGLPVKSKYIIPSAYRPLNETNKESKYYTLNENMYNKDLLRKKVEELKLKPGQSALINSFAPFINENYMNKDEFSQVDPIQNFQIGVNKKGKMYFYDKYDFDFEPATKVVKPYEYEFYNEFKTGGEMIKRADGSYSKRGLWDNIRDNKGSGKAPTKQMLDQERKIRNQYQVGGQIPTVQGNFKKQNEYGYMVTDEEALAKEAQRLNSKKVLTENGSLIIFDDNWNIIAADDNPSAPYKQGGEKDKYWRTGQPMVNDPSMDAISKVLLQRNQDKNFMQRAAGLGYQGGIPTRYIEGQDPNSNNTSNLLMSFGDNQVFPTIIQTGPQQLSYQPNQMEEYIQTPTEDIADYFAAKGYKRAANDMYGTEYKNGGYVVKRSHDRKGKTHVVTGPDGTKKYFGDPNMGERGNSKYGKEAFYARHKSNLAKNPYFRAYARATWKEGGETMAIGGQTMMNPVTRKDNRNWLEFLKN